MNRIQLRRGGKRRPKAIFGIDGAVSAAATLAAAAMSTAATIKASKEQAKAINENAKLQSDALATQNDNANKLQEQLIASNNQMNQENMDAMRDIVLSGQIQAGNENLEYRQQAGRMAVKCGGRRKLSYGGARPFEITDGGGAIAINTDNNGYGLYELYGNDHDHYHKTPGGKYKSGVGVKLRNGGVVEGEGNQGTNQGELMFITPEDALFISKHSIKGFNPAKAVDNGMHPKQAFAYQEAIKDVYGIKDSGNKAKCGGKKSIRHKADLGLSFPNTTATIKIPKTLSGLNYNTSNASGFGNFIGNYGGALMNTAGNLLGAGLTAWGNRSASRRLASAYQNAGDIIANAYSNLQGIDMSQIKRENFEAPHTLAVVRSANTNINPQLQRIERNADSEKRNVNRNTLSSAARQTRNAEIDDRTFQREGEQYAYKHNMDEQIKQQNAQSITQNQQANADRDVQARQHYYDTYLKALIYNNDIKNASITGIAQAKADALTQAAGVRGNAIQSSLQGMGSAIGASGQAFATRYDYLDKYRTDFRNNWYGLGDIQQVDAALASGDSNLIDILLSRYTGKTDEASIANLNKINSYLKRKSIR